MDNAEPTRYRVADIQTQMTLGCGNGGILVTDPNGPIVAYGEYARLKAEVERLTFDPLTYLDDQGEWMPRHIHLAAVERLKAEVERLRKSGDQMATVLSDLLQSDLISCSISRGVIKSTLDKWNADPKESQR